jgi:hypothetical protein
MAPIQVKITKWKQRRGGGGNAFQIFVTQIINQENETTFIPKAKYNEIIHSNSLIVVY